MPLLRFVKGETRFQGGEGGKSKNEWSDVVQVRWGARRLVEVARSRVSSSTTLSI